MKNYTTSLRFALLTLTTISCLQMQASSPATQQDIIDLGRVDDISALDSRLTDIDNAFAPLATSAEVALLGTTGDTSALYNDIANLGRVGDISNLYSQLTSLNTNIASTSSISSLGGVTDVSHLYDDITHLGATSGDISNLNTRLTTIDTNLALKATSAQATAIQGTGFNTATDSLKVLSDVLDAIEGSTFDTSTDSLEAISNAVALKASQSTVNTINTATGTTIPALLAAALGVGSSNSLGIMSLISQLNNIQQSGINPALITTLVGSAGSGTSVATVNGDLSTVVTQVKSLVSALYAYVANQSSGNLSAANTALQALIGSGLTGSIGTAITDVNGYNGAASSAYTATQIANVLTMLQSSLNALTSSPFPFSHA